MVGTHPHITKIGTINFKTKSNTQGETVGLGVTFSGRMPLVIDMTLTGSLNRGPETPSERGNRWSREEL